MDIQVIVDNLPLYFQGLWITIILVVISLILGLCLAIPGHAFDRANVSDLSRHGAV
jgi:ABC-type arginine/histidine transport system permease subunit